MRQYVQSLTLRSGNFKPSANADKRTIYLQPIGLFADTLDMSALVDYTQAFYLGCRVVMLPPIDTVTVGSEVHWRDLDGQTFALKFRSHACGRRQLQVDSLLDLLAGKKRLNSTFADMFCLMGITMEDLYDEEPDLFVAGMVRCSSCVRVDSRSMIDERPFSHHTTTLP